MNLPSTLLDALRQFVSQTPLALWAIAIAVLTAAELVTRQHVPWQRRMVNLVNGSVVLLVIFLSGPLVAGVTGSECLIATFVGGPAAREKAL